jgi:hypothetical protein
MSNPAIQLFCSNGHPMDRGADWCGACGEAPARTPPDQTQTSTRRRINLHDERTLVNNAEFRANFEEIT